MGLNISGVTIDTLAYVDNLNLLSETALRLWAQASELESTVNSFTMTMDLKKTKVMCTTRDPNPSSILVIVSGKVVELVTQLIYLGSLLKLYNSCSDDIKKY